MTSTLRLSQRAARLALIALSGLAVEAVTRDAHATWACTVVDGQDSTNAGHTAAFVNGSASAIVWNGLAVPIYTRQVTLSGVGYYDYFLRNGSDINFGGACNGTDPFSVSDIAGTLGWGNHGADSEFAYHAIQDGSTTWLTWADEAGSVYVGSSAYGPTGGSKIYDATLGGVAAYMPRIVIYNGSPWVFYNVDSAINFQSLTGGTWSAANWLDGTAGHAVIHPTPVVFNNQLWVLYEDADDHSLQGKYWDGTTWASSSANTYNGQGYIDGRGGTNGQTSAYMGNAISAIVDTHVVPNTLYVFYDSIMSSVSRGLRVSRIAANSTTWYAQTVATGFDMYWPSAPTIDSNSSNLQVYYLDTTNHKLMESWRSGSSWAAPVTIDGATPSNCGASATTHDIAGPISVVQRSGCAGGSSGPHVFYGDAVRGNLREAFWF